VVKIAIINYFYGLLEQMDILTISGIALGLSFDSFAVSLSCGVIESRIRFRNAMRIAFTLAFFQGGMTVLGYFLGTTVNRQVERYDHWVAFGLLLILGGRMIFNGLMDDEKKEPLDFTRWPILLTMAIGTSIDAFAIGISFALLKVQIWAAGVIIGAVTFLASMTAIRIGKSAGSRLGSRVEIVGGVILIIIGIRILAEHLLTAS